MDSFIIKIHDRYNKVKLRGIYIAKISTKVTVMLNLLEIPIFYFNLCPNLNMKLTPYNIKILDKNDKVKIFN